MEKNSIIILNYNSFKQTLELLENCLLKIIEHFYIIIVDNNSDYRENEEKLIEFTKVNPNIKYIKLKKNYGYAKGNNVGIVIARKLGSKFAYIMNPDIEIKDQEFLLDLTKEVSNLGLDIVGVKVNELIPYFSRGNAFSYFCPLFLRVKDILIYKILKKIFSRYVICNGKFYYKVYRIYGCFMLINIDTFVKIGCFDKDTFLYAEELILGEKCYKQKKDIYYCDSYEVIHKTSLTTSQLNIKKYFYIYESMIIYFSKYRKFNKLLSKILAFNYACFQFFRSYF